MGLLTTLRNIVDGDRFASGSRNEWPPANRPGDLLAIKLAQAIRATMGDQLFAPPGSIPQVPTKYVAFVSNDDDRLFPGQKRQIVRSWLLSQVVVIARELTKERYTSKSFTLEMRVDATLARGGVRIQPFWEEVAQTALEHASADPAEEIPLVRQLAR